MGKLKGIIFNMDGVITDTSEYHYMAWKLLASHIGIYIDRRMYEQLKGMPRMDLLDVILKHGNKENTFTETEKLALATSKNHRYIDMLNQFSKENLTDGVFDLFLNIKAKGIKIGIVSELKGFEKLVDLLEIKSFVDCIVSQRIVSSKPVPYILLEAAQELNLDTRECVGVMNTKIGIESVKKANMFAVGIGTRDKLPDANIVYTTSADIDLDMLINEVSKIS